MIMRGLIMAEAEASFWCVTGSLLAHSALCFHSNLLECSLLQHSINLASSSDLVWASIVYNLTDKNTVGWSIVLRVAKCAKSVCRRRIVLPGHVIGDLPDKGDKILQLTLNTISSELHIHIKCKATFWEILCLCALSLSFDLIFSTPRFCFWKRPV